MRKDDIKKELHEIAPDLSKVSKENPFRVPDNYFAQLPQQINNRILTHKKSKAPGVFILHKALRPIALVAVFVLIALASIVYISPLIQDAEYAGLNEEEAAFFNDHLAWYSEYETDVYYDFLYSENINDESLIMNDEEVLEYLLDYNEYYSDFPLGDDDLW